MPKKFNYEQKSLLFIKRTRPDTSRHVAVASVVCALLLAVFLYYNQLISAPMAVANREDSAVFVGIVTGEILFTQNTLSVADLNGYGVLLSGVKPWLVGVDYVSSSLGNPLYHNNLMARPEASPPVSSAFVATLANSNMTVLSLADEHAADYGMNGIMMTRQILMQQGIESVGFREGDEALYVLSKTSNGFTVATLGFTDIFQTGDNYLPGKPGLISADPSVMKAAIQEARKKADLVIVHMNWGDFLGHDATLRQQGLAYLAVNAGADVVVGHHPGIPQRVEKYKGKLIIYSMGDLLGGVYWSHAKESALLRLVAFSDGRLEAQMYMVIRKNGIPIVIGNDEPIAPPLWILDKYWSDVKHFGLDKIATNEQGVFRIQLNNWR